MRPAGFPVRARLALALYTGADFASEIPSGLAFLYALTRNSRKFQLSDLKPVVLAALLPPSFHAIDEQF